jgi:hypothetical protein
MLHTVRLAPVILLVAALAGGTASAEKKDGYHTADGKLTSALSVHDVQGGFAGFTGQQYDIQPDGAWTVSRVFNQKVEALKKGKLSEEKLKALAKELAKHELSTLPRKLSTGRPMANPHVVTIRFGKLESVLTLDAGAPVPGTDGENPRAKAVGRFGGVFHAVREAIEGKKEKDKDS